MVGMNSYAQKAAGSIQQEQMRGKKKFANGCLVGLVWWSGLTSTPQVMCSTLSESEFQVEVKKYSRMSTSQSPWNRSRPALTQVTVWVTPPLDKGGAEV